MTKFHSIRLAALTLALFVGIPSESRGAILVADDFSTFNGGAAGGLDPSKWADQVGISQNGSGLASAAGGYHLQAVTSSNFSATLTTEGRETVVYTQRNSQAIFGLSGPNLTGTTGNILLRTDYGDSSFWDVEVDKAGVGSARYHTNVSKTIPGGGDSGTWVIDWYSDLIRVSYDGTNVFDSRTNAPSVLTGTATSFADVSPTVALHPDFGGGNLAFDSIVWETAVPEPSSVGMLVGLAFVGSRAIRKAESRTR